MSDVILKVRELAKSYGGPNVFQDVSFDIMRGERMALIGPNGAGKSTLLNAIGGQNFASAGKITLIHKDKDGNERPIDITKLPPNKRLSFGLGRSYQVNNVFWQLTILENVLLALYGAEKNNLRLINVLDKREDLLAEAERLLKTIDMWEKREESPTLLSYGEQRMLEMLLAFAAKPDIVLLDEPSAGLPTAEVKAFTDTLKALAGDTTLLFCAHDMELVFNLADRIIVLFKTIIANGTPEEISNNVEVQEIYLGSAGDTYDNPGVEEEEPETAAAQE